MKPLKSLATLLIISLTPFTAHAEPINWSEISVPVRAAQWHQLDEGGRTGYIVGALQAAAYLNADKDGHIGCIVLLAEPLLAKMASESFSDMPVIAVADEALNECDEQSTGTGILISSNHLANTLGDDMNGNVWIGFVIGMTDFFHFQTYAKLGDEKAECIQDEALELLSLDMESLLSWTKTPDAPFVEDALMRALSGCGI